MPNESVESVSAQEAVALVESGAVLIDVREDHEWDDGHAPQARHIAMSRFTQADADSLPTDRPVICVCHLGVRSASVATALSRGGWMAMNLTGGMDAWQAAGLPVRAETPRTNTPGTAVRPPEPGGSAQPPQAGM